MNSSNESHRCIVTGASRGIGKAIACYFAHAGYSVIGTSTTAQGAESIDQLASGKDIKGCVLDLSQAGSEKVLIDEIASDNIPVSILINNAGIVDDQLAVRMKPQQWDRVIDVNLSSVFRMTKAALPLMIKQRYGRIINISSVIAHYSNPGQCNYAAAKAGLGGLTRSLAAEVAKRNITVNMVAPGYIETEMTQTIKADHRQKISDRIPSGRFGTMDEVVACVRFLCEANAAYITGTTIHVNGGLYM